MIIQSINNIIKYDGLQILNLMEAPSPDSDDRLYEDYFNFINAIDMIYGTQDLKTGIIPVFKTIFNNETNQSIPDKSSTLHFLIPGNSYFIRIKAETTLPVRVPDPLSLIDFIHSDEDTDTKSCKNPCCPSLQIETPRVSLTSTNTHYINATIINAQSNEKYYYEFEPVFSNWPAELTPISGEILIPSLPDNTPPSGNIQAVFTYAKSLFDDIDSIPYTIDKNINASYYNNNIFSIIKLKLFSPNCVVYDDVINISCVECVDTYKCPTITMSAAGSGLTRYVSVNITDLQPNTEYEYEFGTDSSNCPANISPISGYIINDKNTKTATVYGVFRFCENRESTNCNLEPTNPFADPYIVKTIFNNLSFKLKTSDNTVCSTVEKSIQLTCDKCFGSSDLNIEFALPSANYGGSTVRDRLYYPSVLLDNISYSHFNSTSYRPEIEYVSNIGQAIVNPFSSGLLVPCCEKPIIMELAVTGAVSGQPYTFDIYSYPAVDIVPSTGTISFSEGSGFFSISVNPRGKASSSLHAVLTDEKSNIQASTSAIISCVPTGLYNAAAEAASRHPSGWYQHPSKPT